MALCLLALAALSLNSCGSNPDSRAEHVIKERVYQRQELAPVLVEQMPEPAKPAPPLTDEGVANYIVDIREWGRQGWSQIRAIRDSIWPPVDTQ